jgi:hypothetical protein
VGRYSNKPHRKEQVIYLTYDIFNVNIFAGGIEMTIIASAAHLLKCTICDRHVRIVASNGRSTPWLYDLHTVRRALKDGIDQGLISEEEAAIVRQQLSGLDLPEETSNSPHFDMPERPFTFEDRSDPLSQAQEAKALSQMVWTPEHWSD